MAAPARAVPRLTDGQARTARWGAAFAAVGFLVLWAPEFPKGPALGAAGVGVSAAGLLYWAARRHSVVLTALAAFLVALGPWGLLWIVGAPYLGWAGWLLYRSSKQAAANPRPRPAREAKPAAAPVPAQRRPPRESKRYTPPATRKKR